METIPSHAFVVPGGLLAETAPDASGRPRQALSGPEGVAWRFRFDASELGAAEGWWAKDAPTAYRTDIAVPAA